MTRVPVTFRVDADALKKAREKAGPDKLAEAVRAAVSYVAEGRKLPDLAASVTECRKHLKAALEELGE